MLIPTQKIGKTRNGHANQTHCQNGHEFNEVNTYISPKSQKRSCRICESARKQAKFLEDVEGNRQRNNEHMREWRSVNKERDRKNWTELRRKKKEWLDSQKTACSICGEANIACIDFHHKDSTKKDANLSEAIARWSIKRLQIEMDKCVMICSNCHRKLHAAERIIEKVG
jgi:hypothetical protein